MNSPTPGWHPDPTARHDYRYWDGWEWTDDVADGGVTAYDPLPADDGYPGYETTRYGPTSYGASGNGTSSHRSAGYEPTGYGSSGYGSSGYGSAGYGYDDTYAYGAEPATRRVPDLSYQPPYYASDETGRATKKGPSARLLVGVGLVAVAMVAGLVFVLATGGQGDEQADGTEISDRADRRSGGSTNAGDTTSSSDTTAPGGPSTTATTAPGGPGTTAPGAPGAPDGSAPPPSAGGPGTTAAPPPGGGSGSGSGDEAAVVGDLAELFQNSSAGAMSEDQARCLAQGMVDTVGVEGARALTGGGGGIPPTLTAEQQQQLQQLTMECGMGG